MNRTAESGVARAWMELVRLPNLLTLPGNLLAGIALSSLPFADWNRGGLFTALLAALCLYAFGMITNDLADREEDRRDRPGRPLPSGRVSLSSARIAAIVTAGAGLAAARAAGSMAGWIGLAILGLSAAYNLGLKRFALPGVLTLAACRGLLLPLGAVAGGARLNEIGRPLLGAAIGMGLYVAAVSAAARNETRDTPPSPLLRGLPFAVLLLGFSLAWNAPGDASWGSRGLLALLACIIPARFLAWTGTKRSRSVPAWIGLLLGNLCLIQAAIGLWLFMDPGRIACMATIALLMPLHGMLSKKMAAS